MRFLPPNVPDVNAVPQNTEKNCVLDVLNTSGNDAARWDAARFAELLSGRIPGVKNIAGNVVLVGGNGYIGTHLKRILNHLEISWYDYEDTDPKVWRLDDDVLIHLASPRKLKNISGENMYRKMVRIDKWMRKFSDAVSGNVYYWPQGKKLYFSTQSIFDSPANSLYAQFKQEAADVMAQRGYKIFVPGTVFGSFLGRARVDTAINGIVNRLSREINAYREIALTMTCRSFISIYEVIEAILLYIAGENIEKFQSYNIGRARLVDIMPPSFFSNVLGWDTGISLKNFYPDMEWERIATYKKYLEDWVSYLIENDKILEAM